MHVRTHTCTHICAEACTCTQDVTAWISPWQCGNLSTSIIQRLWQSQESNSLHRITPPSFFPLLSHFVSIFPHAATTHCLSSHQPLLTSIFSLLQQHELESRQQKEQSQCCSENFAGCFWVWQNNMSGLKGSKSIEKAEMDTSSYMSQLCFF